jgi:HAD superfamily hydrolase (TIGR01509 family)
MLTLDPLPIPLMERDGELRVEGTRISLQFVIYEHREGASAEEIVTRFPTLKLAQVHTLLAYYLTNRESVDAYIREREAFAEAVRKEVETRFPQEGLRAKLLARLKKMNIKGVIFDVGGTLIYGSGNHFEHANAWAAATFLRSQGFQIDAEKFTERLVELRKTSPKGDKELRQINTTAEHLQKVLGHFGLELSPEMLLRLEQAFITPEAHGAIPIPDIQEVVQTLYSRVKLAVISNTRSHILIEETVKHLGLRDCFDPFVTSVSSGYRKPSPRIFQRVLDVWKLPPEQVVMIGDSPSNDIAGAEAVGMKTIWLKTDVTETTDIIADKITERARDILRLLEAFE